MDKSYAPPPYPAQPQQVMSPPINTQAPPPYMMPQPQMPQMPQQIHMAPQPVHIMQTWANPICFGSQPQRCVCPNCHTNIITEIQVEASTKTHIMAIVMCGFCCLGCIPYCVDSFQDRNHYCPACRAFLSRYSN